MSIIKTALAGVGLATLGYGAYKGVQHLIENSDVSGNCGDDVNAIIERARAKAEAELAATELGGDDSPESIIGSSADCPTM